MDIRKVGRIAILTDRGGKIVSDTEILDWLENSCTEIRIDRRWLFCGDYRFVVFSPKKTYGFGEFGKGLRYAVNEAIEFEKSKRFS